MEMNIEMQRDLQRDKELTNFKLCLMTAVFIVLVFCTICLNHLVSRLESEAKEQKAKIEHIYQMHIDLLKKTKK